ncbi:hypothetical protein L1887_42389 [Cichorium endivia]|nr:hypothetical protein L1887_42389 [Cichorium endivia]
MEQITMENGVENVQQLPAFDDDFGGVMVKMEEHVDSDVFRTLLKTSMTQWKLQVLTGKEGCFERVKVEVEVVVVAMGGGSGRGGGGGGGGGRVEDFSVVVVIVLQGLLGWNLKYLSK